MLEKVKEILAEQLNWDKAKINENTRLAEDMLADSLDLISAIEAFENEFKISISDEEIEKLSTVKDIVEMLEKKVK